MCTSLTIKTLDQQQLFGRTMDFPTKTPWHLTYLPSQYQWQPKTGVRSFNSKHAILGGMRYINNHFLIGDGINEAGLCCAELYFPVESIYYDKPVTGKLNLSPQDFTTWLLSENSSIAQVKKQLDQIALIGIDWYDHDGIYPFHWLLTDLTGQTVIIEPNELNLHLKNDPVNVLTNTPALAKHITNLNRFLNLNGNQFNEDTINAIQNFTGTLPNRHIPTDRFIKAAFTRWQIHPQDLVEGEATLFNFLETVKIQKKNDRHDYTHYEGVINVNAQTYQFRDVASNTLTSQVLANVIAKYDTAHIF
ncbi:linear amide C-N hydrolase [Paucilactobacillus kaifaensis]|uniref:linear amide C-N hydrolase n=1 Tax=Paucilactobacillus kaifaensis TaxID=2559921 RepID=UPI0010F480A6|nr:linear amide C-N hydrolase [Paucilactobacillus kaifaensis]